MLRTPAIALIMFAVLLPSGAATPPLDLNADGQIDPLDQWPPNPGPDRQGSWWEDTDLDGRLGTSAESIARGDAQVEGRAVEFDLVWDTGTTLDNVRCVAAGDADGNGLFDFAGGHFSPHRIHLFEADGMGTYAESWNSDGTSPAGFYTDIVFGDTDGDGLGEIWGSDYSTLGKVLLFEHDGTQFQFVHDQIAESDFSGNRRIKRIFIADTDQDERQEIIVVTGGSSPTDGLISIWEHSGAIGENIYTEVFEYTTVSYVYQAAVGDADNDGYPEIILGLGGLGGYPLIIRRLEYDPGAGTWQHLSFQATLMGLPLSPHVADLDGDSLNELVYGSADDIGPMVAVFENTGSNSFAARYQDHPPFSSNGVSTAAGGIGDPAVPAFVCGFHGGDLGLWTYDMGGDTLATAWQATDLGGPIYNVAFDDDGEDGLQEILPAVNGRDQILVYRLVGTSSARLPSFDTVTGAMLNAAPNPASTCVRLSVTEPAELAQQLVWILDVQGRLIRELNMVSGEVWWDGVDRRGRTVTSGTYYARMPASPHARSTRIVIP